MEIVWGVPCEPRDAENVVAKYLPNACFPFSSMVVAARPQPSTDYATFLAVPEWTSYVGMTGVVLDLRSAVLGQNGPVIGAFLSRPTNAAEIRREAGLYSMGRCDILVGTSPEPLRDDEQVFLDNGSLVRLVREEFPHETLLSLRAMLMSEDFALFRGPYPRIPDPKVLMLLHHSGRSFFSGQRSAGVPIHTAIVNFVGVFPGSVSFHSPSDGSVERVCHRGHMVRGTVVLADHQDDGTAPCVIFLDLRPVGAAPGFVCLQHPWLSYEDLEQLLPRPAPAGWRLTVVGGHRKARHLEVQHRMTLLLGLVSVLDPSDDCESVPGSAPSGDSDHDEDGEEEDPTDDHSQSSTRSRSRVRGAPAGTRHSPSSDPSFHGSFPDVTKTCTMSWGADPAHDGQCEVQFSYLGSAASHAASTICAAKSFCGAPWMPQASVGPETLYGHFGKGAPWLSPVDLRTAVLFGSTPLVSQGEGLVGFGGMQYPWIASSCGVLIEAANFGPVSCRLPDLPPPAETPYASASGSLELEGTHFLGERNPPQHHLPVYEQPATALVFVPEYPPEIVTTALETDLNPSDAVGRFQAARDEARVNRFDRLLAVRPQPTGQYASLVAFADWHDGVFVLFDCTRYNGTAYATLVSPSMTKGALLSVAGIRPEQSVDVFVADYPMPLQDMDVITMELGYSVQFVAAGWTIDVTPPLLEERWLYLVGDDEPSFFHLVPTRRSLLRRDIAACLGYDVDALQTLPTVPRMSDFCDFGAVAQHVLVLVDRFTQACPMSHYVSISGARPRHEDDGLYFDFDQCQVLTVDYRVQPDSSDTQGDTSDGSVDGESDADDLNGPDGEPPFPLEPDEREEPAIPAERSRSPPRSPRADARLFNAGQEAAGRILADCCGVSASRVAMWRKVFVDAALATGAFFCTAAGLHALRRLATHRPGVRLGFAASSRPNQFWVCSSETGCRHLGLAHPSPRDSLFTLTPGMLRALLSPLLSMGSAKATPGPYTMSRCECYAIADDSESEAEEEVAPTVDAPGSAVTIAHVTDSELTDETEWEVFGQLPAHTQQLPLESRALLWAAAARADCCAFAIANAMLEVLCEAFPLASVPQEPVHAPPVGRLTSAISPGHILTLADKLCPPLVPDLPFQLHPWAARLETAGGSLDRTIQVGTVPVPFTWQQFVQLFGDGPDLVDFAQASAFCPVLRQWSRPGLADALTSACQGFPADDTVCFTDGSYTAVEEGQDLCGWACLFFHPRSQCMRFLYGSFPTFLAEKGFCPSPFQGEVAGLLAAALATTATAHEGVHFLSDCTSALGIAEGACSFAQGSVAQAMRYAHWLRSCCAHGRDSYEHIRGHQGHAGNEVADVLAKAAARKAGPSCGLRAHTPLLCAWLGDGAPYLPWAGLVVLQGIFPFPRAVPPTWGTTSIIMALPVRLFLRRSFRRALFHKGGFPRQF
ncbi:unnamed protein product [Symbiodinium sp. CCMP2592]|nr:unnamed protein product [Symbiodinium sp. CCMP2592]